MHFVLREHLGCFQTLSSATWSWPLLRTTYIIYIYIYCVSTCTYSVVRKYILYVHHPVHYIHTWIYGCIRGTHNIYRCRHTHTHAHAHTHTHTLIEWCTLHSNWNTLEWHRHYCTSSFMQRASFWRKLLSAMSEWVRGSEWVSEWVRDAYREERRAAV